MTSCGFDIDNYTNSSSVRRVHRNNLNFDIDRYIPGEILKLLNVDCVLSGQQLYDIILKSNNICSYPTDDADEFILRSGTFYKYLESFAKLSNVIKCDTITTHQNFKSKFNVRAFNEFDIYTENDHSMMDRLIDDGYRTTEESFQIITELNKYVDGVLMTVKVHDTNNHPAVCFAMDESELTCCKLVYDGTYLYYNMYGDTTSLDHLLKQIIIYDNSYDAVSICKNTTTFRRLVTYISDGFTFMSDDECAKEIYAKFTSNNALNIHNQLLMIDAPLSKMCEAAKLIREEFFSVFNKQKLLSFTHEIWDTHKPNRSYEYNNPYYIQYRQVIIITKHMGLDTLESVTFIPEHTAFAVNFTNRLCDILPYVDTTMDYNEYGKNYNYSVWSNIISRIVIILFSNKASYVHTHGISTTISIIDDILFRLEAINVYTKTRIISHLGSNLFLYYDDIAHEELVSFYFIAKLTKYFGNIQSESSESQLSSPTYNNTRGVVYDGEDSTFYSSSSMRMLCKFTDQFVATDEVVALQHIIKMIESGASDDKWNIRIPLSFDVQSRIVINFQTFTYNYYEKVLTDIRRIYEFLRWLHHGNIQIIIIDMKDDSIQPCWVSMDIGHPFTTNSFVGVKRPIRCVNDDENMDLNTTGINTTGINTSDTIMGCIGTGCTGTGTKKAKLSHCYYRHNFLQ